MPSRGLPLSSVITGTIVTLIAATTVAVAAAGWRASERTVDMLWRELAVNVATSATLETVRLVDDAIPFVDVSHDLVASGELPPADHVRMLRYGTSALDAHRSFTWVSWGDATDGAYLSSFRFPRPDGTVAVRRTDRTQRVDPLTGAPATWYVDDERDEHGWHPVARRWQSEVYDPRTRPWFRAAVEGAAEGVWTDPFVFRSRLQPGVAYARAVRRDGDLLGVWAVEFEMKPLSDFLATVEVGEHGRVYILEDEHGWVIAHPAGEVVTADGSFLVAADHPDPMLRQAWTTWRSLPEAERTAPFHVEGYLAMASPFPARTGIPWVVLTVVPEDDFLGAAREELRLAAVLGFLALLVALALGLALSRSVTRAMDGLREELLKVARFELGPARFSDEPSPFREINEMGVAADRMKQGLDGFARYVPRELVRQLVAAGREAKVGAERREVTILFSDIAGFTPMVESTPPDTVMAALGDYFEAMNEAIAEERGTVAQYLGDGIMAFRGAPEPLDDSALHCARAALRMMDHVDRLLASADDVGHPRLPTRIGLDTGTVMVGNIGAHDRFSYGILGDAVNTTARLEGINKVYGTRIIVGPTAAANIGDRLVLRPLDEVLAVGKVKPTWIFEAVGVPGEVPADVLDQLDRYAEALSHYRAGDFGVAAERFAAIPDDPPSAVMAARCRALARSRERRFFSSTS